MGMENVESGARTRPLRCPSQHIRQPWLEHLPPPVHFFSGFLLSFPQVEIMYHLGGHENIVALHEVYEDKDNVHLLLVGREFMKCGAGWGGRGQRGAR